jgi:predicted AAA+ superfamily ATPase
MGLRYVRDKEGREVDFAILKNGRLSELIEVKLTDSALTTSLRYYHERLRPNQSAQIVGRIDRAHDVADPNQKQSAAIRVSSLSDYLDRPLLKEQK